MPFLSRIPINPMRREAQRLLASPQRTHAAVLAALPSQPVSERTLWRKEPVLDDTGNRRLVNLLVLTQSEPSWAGLIEEAGWPDTEGGRSVVRDYAPLLSQVQLGRQFQFRVTANPTSISHNLAGISAGQTSQLGRGRGVRVGHRSAPHQMRWFLDRGNSAAQWGFTLLTHEPPSVQLVGRERLVFRKHANGPTVTLDTATFEGLLAVADVARLREVLLTGLGRGKAYGCGLLTIAKPRTEIVVAS